MDARDQFATIVGDDVVEALFEALYAKLDGAADQPPFSFPNIDRVDVCNVRFMAFYDAPNGDEWCIIGADGDNAGSEIVEFSKDRLLHFEEHRPTVYSFVPNRWLPSALFGVYLEWRKSPWFQEKVRNYNYDRHFAPGSKTESHYRDWAAKKGLRIASEEDCAAYIARGPMTDGDRKVADELAALIDQPSGEAQGRQQEGRSNA